MRNRPWLTLSQQRKCIISTEVVTHTMCREIFEEDDMTKKELVVELQSGKIMSDIFPFTSGQECLIFKEEEWKAGEDIVYISDMYFPKFYLKPVKSAESLEDILDCCYTGNDFLEAAGGDESLAREFFGLCDWQSPFTVADEVEREMEMEEDVAV